MALVVKKDYLMVHRTWTIFGFQNHLGGEFAFLKANLCEFPLNNKRDKYQF